MDLFYISKYIRNFSHKKRFRGRIAFRFSIIFWGRSILDYQKFLPKVPPRFYQEYIYIFRNISGFLGSVIYIRNGFNNKIIIRIIIFKIILLEKKKYIYINNIKYKHKINNIIIII